MQLPLTSLLVSGAVSAVSASASPALVPTKLPLRWVDERAYATSITINSIPQVLEVATATSDVWLVCSRVSSSPVYGEICATSTCPAILSRGGVNMCASQVNATLSIANGSLVVDEFPADVVLNGGNATAAVSLLGGKTDGELGLGLRSEVFGSLHPELLSNKTLIENIDNFSLYLSENESFLQLGGSFKDQLEGFDSQELLDRGLATRFSLPLRMNKDRELTGWDLSVTAVRFANDQLLYPRVYSASETPGGDATASVALNDPILKMPPAVMTHFGDKYLASNCAVRGDGKAGYECVGLKLTSLPRIAIYLGDKIFHIEASDYAVETSPQLVILVGASSSESRWVLGGPFLRKFPSMFSLSGRCVDLLCQFNVSCDSRARGGAWDPQLVPTSQSDAASSVTPTLVGGDTVTVAPAAPIPLAKTVVIWMGFSFGVVGFCLVIFNAIRQRSHRNDPNAHGTGTVASDKDLEELTLAARDMSSSSEVRAADFTPLASPAAEARV